MKLSNEHAYIEEGFFNDNIEIFGKSFSRDYHFNGRYNPRNFEFILIEIKWYERGTYS